MLWVAEVVFFFHFFFFLVVEVSVEVVACRRRVCTECNTNCKRILTQHSRNCLASMGDVKLRPQVSLVIGSFQ